MKAAAERERYRDRDREQEEEAKLSAARKEQRTAVFCSCNQTTAHSYPGVQTYMSGRLPVAVSPARPQSTT